MAGMMLYQAVGMSSGPKLNWMRSATASSLMSRNRRLSAAVRSSVNPPRQWAGSTARLCGRRGYEAVILNVFETVRLILLGRLTKCALNV